jgi:hypothetical protein
MNEQHSAGFHVEVSDVSKVYCFATNGITFSENCVEGSRDVCKADDHLINVFLHGGLAVGSVTPSIILVANMGFLISFSMLHERFPVEHTFLVHTSNFTVYVFVAASVF